MPARPTCRRIATRERLGATSFRISNCLAMNSGPVLSVDPVMFPPGRARLLTNPVPTGSIDHVMTMGMVVVACFSAAMPGLPPVTTTSGLSRTSSAAKPGIRSYLNSA